MVKQRLNAIKFEDMIRRRGRQVLWQEAITCSCAIDGRPKYQCAACKGMGMTLAEPVQDVVVLQSVTTAADYQEMAGIFETGDAVMTVGARVPNPNPQTGLPDLVNPGRENPIFEVGIGDLVTLTDDEFKTSEVLVKGNPLGSREPDELLNEKVTEVLRVQRSNEVTGEIMQYKKDTDFAVKGNKIEWLGVNEPEDGENYTVLYKHRPVYIVFTQLPTPRHQDGQDLPKNVALRYRAGGIDNR